MTWKLYVLASGGAFLATYALSFSPNTAGSSQQPAAQPPGAIEYEVPADFLEQTERLRARLLETPVYREPDRNAFSFGAAPGAVRPEPVVDVAPAARPAVVSTRPPFAVAGIASDVEDGVAVHTAILSSLRGVILAREGDIIEGGYRVLRVDEAGVTVESPDGSGQRTRMSLSGY